MKITKVEWDKLQRLSKSYKLKIKDNYLLKSFSFDDSNRSLFSDLLKKPYIINSGSPIDFLVINHITSGIIMYYYNKAVLFRNAISYPLNLKVKACLDIEKQLEQLHSYGVCFNDIHIDNLLIDEDSGHLVDFEAISYLDGKRSLSRYFLKYDLLGRFDISFNADNYKALICYFSLIYGIDIESVFYKRRYVSINEIVEFFKETSIYQLICDANKNILLGDEITKFVDFLPFFLEEERVCYDSNILKKKINLLK